MKSIPLIILAVLLLMPRAVYSQVDGLTVSAVGEVSVMPSIAEMKLLAVGQAELADDAIVKYEDSKRRALAAIKALKINGLTISEEGFALHQGKQTRQGNAALPGQVTISEHLVLKLTGIDKMEATVLLAALTDIANTAKDSGLQSGSPGTTYYRRTAAPTVGPGSAVFVVPGNEQHEQQATAKAVAAARKKAATLAAECGVTLGAIRKVSSRVISSKSSASQIYDQHGQPVQTGYSGKTTSAAFKPIAIKSSVTVTFTIN